ncbi:MAG: electron transporter RnfD [Ruminococcus sp.]|nr:electron transporter RnfD [Ruminococcus sp.]
MFKTIVPEGKIIVAPDSGNMSYMGRIEMTDPASPRFIWAGSNVRMRFTGTSVSALIRNRRFYNSMLLGFIIDGREDKIAFGEEDGEYLLELASGLEEGEHEIILFKRQDATHYFDFGGFIIDGDAEALDPPELPERKIECFGDSVSAGAVVEAVENVGQCDPEPNDGRWDNAWHSYAAITARNLGAQLNDTAQGGISVFDRTGYYHSPDCIGMETAYDKTQYFPEDGGYTPWDFGKYIPDLVIFAVGQNDQHVEGGPDPDIRDEAFRRKWKDGYIGIINSLREKYPEARFVLLLTVLCHDPEWDKAVEEITQELGDEKITHFMFTRTGKATPGHPRLPEQYEMATELTAYISTKLAGKLWQDR